MMRLSVVFLAAAVGSSMSIANAQTNLDSSLAKASSTVITSPGGGGLLAGGSDSCSTADPIAGVGSFFFDNSLATTGTEGQSESICYEFGTVAMITDVWFDWTSDFTGLAQVDTCGSPTDTKVAAYPGAGCPVTGTALDCNDDSCGWQSVISFNVTSGQTYAIQVGLYPFASGGTGMLNISGVVPPPCGQLHDGVAEGSLGVSASNDGSLGWISYEDCLTQVDSMEAAFGLSSGLDGVPLWIVVYDDPTNDMNPADAVLLHAISIPGGTMNSNTGIMNVFDFTALLGAPIAGTGGMFFGCVVDVSPAATYPAAWDTSSPNANTDWYFGNVVPNVMDMASITNNQFFGETSPWGSPDYLITVNGTEIGGEPGMQYCPGDGLYAGCPCGNVNDGSMGGCDWGNPAFPGGGVLTATGSNSMASSDAFLVANNIDSDFGVFFAAANQTAGLLSDGIRCAGGGLVRLIPPTNPGANTATHAVPLQILDPGAAAGVTRNYQYWFRTNPGVCGNLANTTNGYSITWL